MIGKTFVVHIEFTEPILGAVPKNKEIYADFIAAKAPAVANGTEEAETVAEAEERGWTGFHMLDGRPILYDYAVKGFFKDACSMLSRVDGTESKKLKAFKKIIDGLVFVQPRRIPLLLPTGGTIGVLERPLRAQTAQGERVALARSDTCPPGTSMEFRVLSLGVVGREHLDEWFTYGGLRGLGQWRNAGHGSFTYTLAE